MLPQPFIFIIRQDSRHLYAFGSSNIFRTKPLKLCFGIKAACPLLLSTLLLFGLTGCRNNYNSQTAFVESDIYKEIRPVKVDTMSNDRPGVSAEIDVTTGKPIAQPSPASLQFNKVPTPYVSPAKITMDNPNVVNEAGERTTSWTSVYDIYWKLNWARKELLSGNVPKDLPEVVVRARKHSDRIAHEGLHIPRDKALKLSETLTVEQCLEPANAALQYLDMGLAHMEACRVLETASIPWRTLPWSANVTDMQRALERMNALPAAKKTFSGFKSMSSDDETSSRPVVRYVPSSAFISTEKQAGAALILRYAAKYHASPEQCAHKEFERALQEILKMREFLDLRYKSPSVPGDTTMLPDSLHQEPGGMLARPDHYLPGSADNSTSLPDMHP